MPNNMEVQGSPRRFPSLRPPYTADALWALKDSPALILRIGFACILYYNYSKEPPQNSIGNCLGPCIKGAGRGEGL